MARTFEVEVTVPEGLKEGDTFKIEVEAPRRASGTPRGQLAGIALEEMTDEQLKREIINASSVLYKAKKRGASEDTIAINQARVDAARAEKDKRTALNKAEEASVDTEESVYTEETEVDADTASEM